MNARPAALALVVCLGCGAGHAAAAPPGPEALASPEAELRIAGIALPRFVHVPAFDAHLRLSGAAEVHRHYLPFYVVALYVGAGPVDSEALTQGRERCRIVLHWLTPELDDAAARAYWEERFDRAIVDPQQRARLDPAIDRLTRALGGARRGEVLELDYDPERGLTVSRGGVTAGRFPGLEFNRAVLALWLGPRAGADVRAGLLGGPAGAARDAMQ